MTLITRSLITALVALPLLALACSDPRALADTLSGQAAAGDAALHGDTPTPVGDHGTADVTDPAPVSTVADAPLADFQVELLELAFDAASAMPMQPHVKNRSRQQDAVVTACLQLDQPVRARSYAEQIRNWRRGTALADVAFHHAEEGHLDEVQPLLDEAREVAQRTAVEEEGLSWRMDRIRAKMARTYALLGDHDEAARLETDLADSETGMVAQVVAGTITADEFDVQLEALGPTVEQENFDRKRNALAVCARLFDRFYTDTERRERVESLMRSVWGTLPAQPRMELQLQLAESALAHGDQYNALALVKEIGQGMDATLWSIRYRVPMLGKLAAMRHRAGDHERARREVDAARDLYVAQEYEIVNIWRAGTLRPMAEAYQAMGATDAAIDVYKLAVEAGIENPNSRPRAEDLSATCLSLARHGVEPDAALWSRLRAVRDGLGAPW